MKSSLLRLASSSPRRPLIHFLGKQRHRPFVSSLLAKCILDVDAFFANPPPPCRLNSRVSTLNLPRPTNAILLHAHARMFHASPCTNRKQLDKKNWHAMPGRGHDPMALAPTPSNISIHNDDANNDKTGLSTPAPVPMSAPHSQPPPTSSSPWFAARPFTFKRRHTPFEIHCMIRRRAIKRRRKRRLKYPVYGPHRIDTFNPRQQKLVRKPVKGDRIVKRPKTSKTTLRPCSRLPTADHPLEEEDEEEQGWKERERVTRAVQHLSTFGRPRRGFGIPLE